MKVFFDTSVLVAAFVPAHPRHERAFTRVHRARAGEGRMVIATHTLAEAYSVLTTLPLSPRIPPGAAARILRENLEGHADLQALTAADYREAVRHLGEAGLAGGIIYDALAFRAAIRAGAEVILTCNPKDFSRLWPGSGVRVEEP